MSESQEMWNEISTSAQKAVDNMREFQKHMQEISDAWQSSVAKVVSDRMAPPEPQWKPGQYVTLKFNGVRYLAERDPESTGWLVPGWTAIVVDVEVTDVEPVVVLTADDARKLRRIPTDYAFEDYFAERGLDV